MKVFVGFGYNAKDKWVEDLVLPLIEALNCQPDTGEEMQGDKLSDGVIEKIRQCDCCIGMLTKRDGPGADGFYTTHQWVIEELAIARTLNKPAFVIREKGVDPQKGVLGDTQRFEFDDKAAVLIEITKFVMRQKSRHAYKTFMLLPDEFSNSIKANLNFLECTYTFLHKANYYEPEKAKIIRMQGGFGMFIKNIPHDEALVEINVKGPGGISWVSGFVPVGLMNITLQKDN